MSFWDNEQDALEEYKYLLRENEEGGIHDCKVFMAIVSCIDDIETNY
nr:hypothetical protein [Mycobacterium sp. E3298]